jgi:molybdate/tungstate transport system ATP-binding protein
MIRIEDLSIRLLEFRLRNINLAIEENEFFMLMGPTGAGKTVLLEAIAGLTRVDRGRILVRGRDVTGLPSEKRGVGIVYQDQALFPHLSVRENIAYGLRFHHVGKEEGKKRLIRLTQLLGIHHLLSRLPVNLSGGEKQRVALARALIVQPHVLLLDEPLSAIDPVFREEIRNALKVVHENSNTTFLMVTHDFGEALALADRGAVIHRGSIEQVGAIHDIFHRPASIAVAEFVGMKNLFEANFRDGAATIQQGFRVRLNRQPDPHHRYVAIRPEEITVSRDSPSPNRENTFPGNVSAVVSQGFAYELHVKTGDLTFKALVTKRSLVDLGLQEGREVYISFDSASVHTF